MFTKAQIREIAEKMGWWGQKDSSFPATSVNSDDTVAVVQDDANKNVTAEDFQEYCVSDNEKGTRTFVANLIVPPGETPHSWAINGAGSMDIDHEFSAGFGRVIPFAAYCENGARIYHTIVSCGIDNTSVGNRLRFDVNLYPSVTFAIYTELQSGAAVEGGPIKVYVDNELVGETNGQFDEYGYEHVVVEDVLPGKRRFKIVMQEPSGHIPAERVINGSLYVRQTTTVRVNILNTDERE